MFQKFWCHLKCTGCFRNIDILWDVLGGPGNDGSEGVLHIPQSSSITGASSSDCLVSYPGHSFGERSYIPLEMQSVYYTAPGDWAGSKFEIIWSRIGKVIRLWNYICLNLLWWLKCFAIFSCVPSRKLSKLDKPDMQDTAGEAGTSS